MHSTHAPNAAELAALFDAHFDYVWRSLLRLGVSRGDAEDLAQEVFLIVQRRLPVFDRERPIRPWLFGIAHFVARDFRKLARHRHRPLDGANEEGVQDPAFARLEDAELVYRALGQIDPGRRAILIMYELDGISIEDAARELDIPINTAYSRLRRGREDFRRLVHELLEARHE
jgi:RNA polymerase sigma-70 factor (ECF subfamily)